MRGCNKLLEPCKRNRLTQVRQKDEKNEENHKIIIIINMHSNNSEWSSE